MASMSDGSATAIRSCWAESETGNTRYFRANSAGTQASNFAVNLEVDLISAEMLCSGIHCYPILLQTFSTANDAINDDSTQCLPVETHAGLIPSLPIFLRLQDIAHPFVSQTTDRH